MDNLGLVYFPNQKIPSSKKTDEWCQRCIDAAENLLFFKDPKIAKSRRNKVVNYNLLNGEIMDSDIHDLFNPFGIDGGTAPTNIQDYNLIRSKIDLLTGEEFKRNFDWRLYSVNQDSVSLKEEKLKEEVFNIAVEAIKKQEMDENAIEKRLKSLEQYMKYQYQDLRELTGTRILEHLWHELRLKPLFNKGMYDALTVSEEIYRTDIIGGRPVLERVNPLNFEALMMGSSTNIEDAEITIEYSYKGIGKIVEEYYDYLTEEQIDKLEKGNYYLNNLMGRPNMWINQNYEMPVEVIDLMYNRDGQSIAGLANSQMFDGFGTYINERGELRVLIARWKSRIPRFILSMINPETGDKMETLVSEYFKVTPEMKDMGVSVKKIWVNEWYEGVKIGQDIYVKMGPRKVQFRNMINPAIAKSGYVGSYYNINDSKAYSLVDRMKPFQYLYNVIMRRIELAIAAWKPPITEINLALKPNDWSLEEWMHYLANGFSVINPFNTITEGPAKGTIVGTSNTFNQGARAVPSDSMGQYISQNINLLMYIETMMGKVTGITDQREGQISNSETVGGVERSVNQSSHITEYWFIVHDDIKLRALEALLETAKIAYKDLPEDNQALSHILDDMSIATLKFDKSQFVESNYGLFAVNSQKTQELRQVIKELAHAGIQNDKLNFSQLLDIYTTESMSSMRRKIETAEYQKEESMRQQQEQEYKAQQQAQQNQLQFEESLRQDAKDEKEKDRMHELLLKRLELNAKLMENSNPDEMLKKLELDMKQLQMEMDRKLEEKRLEEDKRKNKAAEALKKEEIGVKRIAANKKPVTSTKK